VTDIPSIPESLSFEEAYENLESLVEALEDGSIPLHQMVEDYERASRLLKICQQRLKDAEARIEILRPDQSGATDPFHPLPDQG
jgi:exodeoxyribonuclease VII small subunit